MLEDTITNAEQVALVPLRVLTQGKVLSNSAFLNLSCVLAETLLRLHAEHIIHGGIQPDRIFVAEPLKAYFSGIKSESNYEHNPEFLLQDSGASDEVAYMAPEQVGHQGLRVDARTDIYSLGIVLYELACSCLPYNEDTVSGWIHAHLAKAPIQPRHWNERIPTTVSHILLKCLQKDPRDRYQSAYGLLKDLERCKELSDTVLDLEDMTLGEHDILDSGTVLSALWGRDAEMQQLSEGLAKTAQGESTIFCVTGPAGIGKSTLLEALFTHNDTGTPFTAFTRCEDNPWNPPYSVLVSAFREILRNVLEGEQAEAEAWRQNLVGVSVEQVSSIVELLPELAMLVPDLPTKGFAVPPTVSQAVAGFQALIRSFTRSGSCVILFIDDVQLADELTRRVLRRLLMQEIPRVAWLLGIDENSLNPNPGLIEWYREVSTQREVTTFVLEGLQPPALENILCKIYPDSKAALCPLADSLYDQTQGHPLLIRSMLMNAQRKNSIWFDADAQEWRWNLSLEQDSDVSGEPWERVQPLSVLPKDILDVLQFAACIGERFELDTLVQATGFTEVALNHSIQSLLTEHFLRTVSNSTEQRLMEPSSDESLQFAHKRIYEDCLATVDPEDRCERAFRIGITLLKQSDRMDSPGRFMDIATHLNQGRSYSDNPRLMAEVNLLAGQYAVLAEQYSHARDYFQQGLDFVQDIMEGMNRQGLNFELRLGFAQALSATENSLSSRMLYEGVLEVAVTEAQTDAVLLALVRFDCNRGHWQRAKEVIETHYAGGNAGRTKVIPETIVSQFVVYGMPLENLSEFSPSGTFRRNSAEQGYRNGILRAWHSALQGYLKPSRLRTRRVFYRKDNSEIRAENWRRISLPLYPMLEMYEGSGDRAKQSHLHFLLGVLAYSTRPKDDCLRHLVLAREQAFTEGDYLLAVQAQLLAAFLEFTSGTSLRTIISFLDDGWVKLKPLATPFLEDLYRQFQDVLKAIIDGTPMVNLVQAVEENPILPWLREPTGLLFSSYCIVFRQPHVGSTSNWEAASTSMRVFQTSVWGEILRALAWLDAWHNTPNRQRQEHRRISRHLKGLLQRSDMPERFRPLLRAEYLRIQAADREALELYESAAAQALAVGDKMFAAIATERAADIAISRQAMNYARALLTAAIDDYSGWGASVKAQRLEAQHAVVLRRGKGERRRPRTGASPISAQGAMRKEVSLQLDWMVVSQAAQALSREVVLERLLTRLMELVLASAGAQRGFILLVRDDKLFVEVMASVDEPQPVFLKSVPIENYRDMFSLTIVADTYHKQADTVLANASVAEEFQHDAYIRNCHPKSVLCVPMLSRQRVIGILYLENNRLTHAFTEDRLELMKVLAAQAAISIENALFYRSLERKVRERTRALELSTEALTQVNQQLEQANQSLLESEAMRRDLLANVSHDLRTPITLISGYAEALMNGIAENRTQAQEFARRILEKSHGLTHLIEDLFNLVRLEARKIDLQLEPCTAEELLVDIAMRYEDDIHQAGLQFTWSGVDEEDITQEGTWIEVDRERIYQVFANLIYNAMKHTETGGSVNLSLEKTEQQVVYRVSDTGSGIRSEDVPHVFERFYKADKSRSHHAGSGLGLAIAKQIVDLHQGEIGVSSTLGEGTTFIITLSKGNTAN